ncbi:MAG TPA: DUF1611 domain-containing protein [Ktedonobacteraceae bacterium]|jgi:uncharacterized NAD-dependent epimerase/dehydratase family protein|nr:DUF1611 domain-containing protein [Ktedonobacteraceae bacterium]
MRRIAILAEGSFEWKDAKTAIGVIRYGKDSVVAVIDSTKAGQDVAQVLKADFGGGIPIVRNINEALEYQPDALLIGITPRGGLLPSEYRWQLLTAIKAGLDIINGLHVFLSDDEEWRTAAAMHGVTIWDVRRPPNQKRIAAFTPHRSGSYTVLFVGSDCSTGKMSAALELNQEALKRGLNSAFIATGQTGIMISGNGLPADAIVSDFIAGLMEEIVLDFTNRHDWVFVEGQGSLNHPAYSPVTLGLIHGSMPDAMIFCHRVGATTINGYEHCTLPSLKRLIEINEEAVSWLRPDRSSKVVGLSLITNHLSEQEARDAVKRVKDETGLPATDVVRFGAGILIDALLKSGRDKSGPY